VTSDHRVSPHAYARICSIQYSRALELPGVLAVLTGTDAVADGLRLMSQITDWVDPPDAELRR
ncbi:uncharacterized protein METZ01_LOCUS366668, partial [marine metagenome]